MFKRLVLLTCLLQLLFSAFVFTSEESEKAERDLTREKWQVGIVAATLKTFEIEEITGVWPRFDLNDVPTIVHFKNGHIYGFGVEASSKWETVSVEDKKVHFCDHDHWGVTKVMMHPAFPLEGQKSFIFQLNTEMQELSLPLITFVHERFHLHQFKYFSRHEEKFAKYTSEWDEENQVLLGMENQLLTKFLQESETSLRKELLKDFIAINIVRQELLNEPSAAWEDLQQRMEGLADYASLKTFATFPLLGSFSIEKTLLNMRANKTGSHFSLVQDAIKGRHYFVGAVLGFALDFCQVDWKTQTENGMPLRVLLARALDLSEQEISERVANIKKTTEYNEMNQKIKQTLATEKKEIEDIIQSYEDLDGLSVHVFRPMQPISGGGKNLKNVHLGNGKTVSLRDTSFSSSRDSNWKLRLKDIPLVFEDGMGGRIFKVQNDLVVHLDGKPVNLKEVEDKELPFSSMTWEDKHCEFTANLPGKLQIIDDEICVLFH